MRRIGRGHTIVMMMALSGLGLLTPRLAQACAGGLVTRSGSLVQADAQRVLMSVRADTTEVVTEVTVPATTDDYGVLIPLPALPTLDDEPVSVMALDELDAMTEPEIVVSQPSAKHSGFLGCGSASKGGAVLRHADAGIQVGGFVDIGPVTAVVLDASSADALRDWLSEADFEIPAAQKTLVSDYSGPGRYFVALRRNDTAAKGQATRVGIHLTLPGDVRDFPLRFASLGADRSVAFTVFMVAPQASAPASPYETLTLDDLDRGIVAEQGYAAAVADAVQDTGNHAFVVEARARVDELDLSGNPLRAWMDADARLTRLSTIVDGDALDLDVVMDARAPSEVPRELYARSTSRPASGALGWLAVVACAGAGLRRRSRRA